MVTLATERVGGLDILMNNAGIEAHPVQLKDIPDAQWDRVIEVNGAGCSNAGASCRLCIFIKRSTRMRVVVDLNRCLGYAQCVFLAPSVFKLNGEEALQYDPNPDDATRLKVLRAAAACPVQAILVEHLSDKQGEATS